MYDWVLKKKGISQNSNDNSVQGVKKDNNMRKSDDKLQLNSGQINNNNVNNNKEMSNNNLKDMKKKNSLENL